MLRRSANVDKKYVPAVKTGRLSGTGHAGMARIVVRRIAMGDPNGLQAGEPAGLSSLKAESGRRALPENDKIPGLAARDPERCTSSCAPKGEWKIRT